MALFGKKDKSESTELVLPEKLPDHVAFIMLSDTVRELRTSVL